MVLRLCRNPKVYNPQRALRLYEGVVGRYPTMRRKKEKKYIRIVKQILRCLKRLRVRRFNSKFSKRTFNNWVHIVLLALRQRMDKSYREFCEIIDVCTELLDLLGINRAPHFTTLQKAARKLETRFLERVMSGFVLFTMAVHVRTGIDATGLQPTRASAHYTTVLKKNKKSRHKIRNHIKLSTFVDLGSQVIISQKIRRSPAHDNRDFKPVVKKGKEVLDKAKKKIRSVDADKGYDSEENHRMVVEELEAEDRIKVKNKDKPIHKTAGVYRKKAKRRIKRLRANYRSKNETVFSVIKRISGSTIRSIKVSMQNKEVLFKEIVYNANRTIKNVIDFLKEVYRAYKSKSIYTHFAKLCIMGDNDCEMCGSKMIKIRSETIVGEAYDILKCEKCRHTIARKEA